MHRVAKRAAGGRAAAGIVAIVVVTLGHLWAQTPTLVSSVRAALAKNDFTAAEQLLDRDKAARGTTSEWLEAYSWLGRSARVAGRFEQAEQYAQTTHALVLDALKRTPLEQDTHLQTALGAAIEVEGHVAATRGARSEGVAFLQRELDTYRHTPIAKRIQKDLNLLTLEGTVAPPLDRSEGLGPASTLALTDVQGKVTIVFFWAHWCPDCKAQAPILKALLDKYRDRGLTIVAPTMRYGYVAKGKDASPDEEKQWIASIRDTYYAFLPDEAITLSEANHLRYGVSTTPTLVLLDRDGIVRAYHPGTMRADELEPLIERYLALPASGTAAAIDSSR